MQALYEQYRPVNWALDKIKRLMERGLDGRAFWISGSNPAKCLTENKVFPIWKQ